jgi:hypothetical protein
VPDNAAFGRGFLLRKVGVTAGPSFLSARGEEIGVEAAGRPAAGCGRPATITKIPRNFLRVSSGHY